MRGCYVSMQTKKRYRKIPLSCEISYATWVAPQHRPTLQIQMSKRIAMISYVLFLLPCRKPVLCAGNLFVAILLYALSDDDHAQTALSCECVR